MDSRFVELLRRRLEAGEPTIEVVVVEPGPGLARGARFALAPDGSPLLPAEPLSEGLLGDVAAAARDLGPARRSHLVTLGEGARVYLERWAPPPRVVVFGGGHVGKALCGALRDLEFSVTVVEDRAYFADARRFEGEVQVVQAPFEEGPARAGVGPEDSVIIATRGHAEDLTCLRVSLAAGPYYLGLLGSRRKMREFAAFLEAEGVPPAQLARVRCPVGLAIGAETPEEIALAAAAELLAVHRGRDPRGPPAA